MTDKKIIKCGLCDANVIVPEDTERGFGFALHLIECEVCAPVVVAMDCLARYLDGFL